MKAYQRQIQRQINPTNPPSPPGPPPGQDHPNPSTMNNVPPATLNHMRDMISRISKKNAE